MSANSGCTCDAVPVGEVAQPRCRVCGDWPEKGLYCDRCWLIKVELHLSGAPFRERTDAAVRQIVVARQQAEAA